VIRIRYRDFSAAAGGVTWLYGRAERSGAGTVVYLLPGLSAGQRRAAIRRLRQEASRGLGPPLPPAQLLLAIAVDRVRATFGIAVAVIRLHPAAALLPGACAAALAAFFLLAVAGGPGGPPPGGGPGSRGATRTALAAAGPLAGNRTADDAGPLLRPRSIVIVPAASRATAWYVRARGPAGCVPRVTSSPPLTLGQPLRCSKPRTAP
jgi:hypothetical protein